MGYRFIHLTTTHSNSFLFMIERYSIVYMYHNFFSVQLCPTLWDPMDCSTPVFPVHHQLPELAQTHVHWVGDAIQPSHPLLPPSPALSLSQHQGLFQWVGSSHQVAKVLELQLQRQSFQWIFRTDFLYDFFIQLFSETILGQAQSSE